jgi:hypothetical protein
VSSPHVFDEVSEVSGLGRRFLDGLFDLAQGKYPNTKFEMDISIASNRWLSEKFRLTEKRMLTYNPVTCQYFDYIYLMAVNYGFRVW